MKKAFVMLVGCCLMGCNSNGGIVDQGSDNACQYAKEKIGVLSEDIASIEVAKVDSMLSSSSLSMYMIGLYNCAKKFRNGEMSEKEYKENLDLTLEAIDNVSLCWAYGDIVNDSLQKLEKLHDSWRKTYTIKVNMKSGKARELRVIMDKDGITPNTTEKELLRELNELSSDVNNMYRSLRY